MDVGLCPLHLSEPRPYLQQTHAGPACAGTGFICVSVLSCTSRAFFPQSPPSPIPLTLKIFLSPCSQGSLNLEGRDLMRLNRGFILLQRYLLDHVHCCSIYNSQKLKTAQMSGVCLHNGLLFTCFKNAIIKFTGK